MIAHIPKINVNEFAQCVPHFHLYFKTISRVFVSAEILNPCYSKSYQREENILFLCVHLDREHKVDKVSFGS